MSVVDNSFITRQIDSVFDKPNFRSEWRFQPNTVYLSNMRLLDQGIASAAANFYNPITGAFCIDSIQLYDGNVLLDQVLEASLLKAWLNANHTNDENVSVENEFSKNQLGYYASGRYAYEADGTPTPGIIKVRAVEELSPINFRSWLNLKELLPFLRSSLIVPTNVFKNLRLIVNWKNNEKLFDLVLGRQGTLTTIENTFLSVDEVIGEDKKMAFMKAYAGVSYMAVESDRVLVNAIADPAAGALSTVQQNRFLVNGFNNKTLSKLRFTNQDTVASNYVNANETVGFGNQGSRALPRMRMQIRVNGANKLPRNGATGANERLGMLTDMYGDVNIVPGQNSYANTTPSLSAVVGNQVANTVKQLDYTAIEVNERVNELIVELDRVAIGGDPITTQPINLIMFGEVMKAVQMIKGTDNYQVAYM